LRISTLILLNNRCLPWIRVSDYLRNSCAWNIINMNKDVFGGPRQRVLSWHLLKLFCDEFRLERQIFLLNVRFFNKCHLKFLLTLKFELIKTMDMSESIWFAIVILLCCLTYHSSWPSFAKSVRVYRFVRSHSWLSSSLLAQ
jgi:hypothetical protein